MMNRRKFLAASIAGSLAGPLANALAYPLAGSKSRLIDSHVHVWKHDPRFPFAEGTHPPRRMPQSRRCSSSWKRMASRVQ